MNIGVPGYGMDQIYLSYQEIARTFHPDMVLIGIFPEDFWRCKRSFPNRDRAGNSLRRMRAMAYFLLHAAEHSRLAGEGRGIASAIVRLGDGLEAGRKARQAAPPKPR